MNDDLRLIVDCVSERDFHALVVALARRFGWLVSHTARAQVKGGRWITPACAGVPDLLLVRPPRVVFVELKAQEGRLTPEQRAWLDALGKCHQVECHLWRPGDWQAIQETLG
ncbi:MAG: VRR-NUC domain-containing protein [Fimbriimonadales bacterium]|nr:VRR-NUC domain-containing protein [Fimbriimonadales bacterium]